MTDEILKLGSQAVIVQAQETYGDEQHTCNDKEQQLADDLYTALQHKQDWSREQFGTVTADEIVYAVQRVAAMYAAEYDPAPFEFDKVVMQAAHGLSLSHRLLVEWVLEVRIGLQDVWAATKDLTAVSL